MPSREVNIALGVGATAVALVAGYAAYFDYKRQTDREFRRKLRKDNKKVSHHVEASKSAERAGTRQDLIKAIIEISQEPTPRSPEESEKYFMENVSIGERLSTLGPEAYVPAALSFYRALRIYPAPAELIGIYEKTVLPPVFEIVKELIALSNAIAQTTAQATAGVSAAAPAELGIDGEDDEEEQMMKALQAAIAGAGQA